MQSNALLFILAGYENNATVMAFTLFCLANNPECLKKAQDEVNEKVGKVIETSSTEKRLRRRERKARAQDLWKAGREILKGCFRSTPEVSQTPGLVKHWDLL